MVDAGAASQSLTSSSGGTATLAAEGGELDVDEARAADEPSAGRPSRVESLKSRLKERDLWLIALVIVPFVVSALALIFAVGADYLPESDHALTEMQVRDVGRHPVLVGLYSRADWNHPGPAEFYVLAPFYWLSGGSSIGMNLGTLAVNAASVAGMAILARRRGGTPLLLFTLLGCALLMRTLGAEFLLDPWNCFITVLPFGLMLFLTWALMCGDVWALPIAVFVASFLAQVHVGFVALALPLLALGMAGLLWSVWRGGGTAADDDADGDDGGWRRLLRPGLAGAAVGGVLWLPVAIDILTNAPSNLTKITRWFRAAEEGTHTLGEGWRIITGQFGRSPEWLIGWKGFAFPSGQSRYQSSAPLPVWLLLLAAAMVVLWRFGKPEGRRLVVVLCTTMVLGIVAIARTIGVAFEYRLRWTWVPPMLALVLVAWTGWQLAVKRWPQAVSRGLVPVAAAGLIVLTGVNGYTAATAGTPQHPEILSTLMPPVIEAIGEGEGQVVVDDPYAVGAWYMRGIVLQLERRGVDVKVSPARVELFGEHRVVDESKPVRARLFVMQDDGIEVLEDAPNLEMVARWTFPAPKMSSADQRRLDELDADLAAGRIEMDEYFREVVELNVDRGVDQSLPARDVAVFMEKAPPPG